MRRVFGQVLIWVLKSFAMISFFLHDLPSRLRATFLKVQVPKRLEFRQLASEHKHILLVAVFQSGKLRDDLQHLFSEAYKRGFTVVVLNNSSLIERPEVHYYEETYNYGRDFAAYRRAFLVSAKAGILEAADTVTFLNDSVFFIPERIGSMLEKILTEVGSTNALAVSDNHDTRYHLASYFVALGREVFSDSRMLLYWTKYKASNSRPTIIRRGEFDFSKTILSIAGRSNVKIMHSPDQLARSLETIRPELLLSSSLAAYLENIRTRDQEAATQSPLHRIISSDLLIRLLNQGAPAHSLVKVFLENGMPVIKLDLFYRGIASIVDLYQIAQTNIRNPDSRDEFLKVVMMRGIGSRDLKGLRRLWHSFGLV